MLLVTGGTIYTLDAESPTAGALLVGDNGRVLAAGAADELAGAAPRATQLDLAGLTAIPGLVDSHTHFLSFARRLEELDLDGCSSLDEVLARAAARARVTPDGKWLEGDGWNKNAWETPVFPTCRDLDRAVPGHPAIFASKDGHSIWLNTRAMGILGIDRETAVPPGSEMQVDGAGEPTGIFYEAGWLQERYAAVAPRPDSIGLIRRAIKAAWQMGLVGVHDCEGLDVWGDFARLDRDGDLGFRVNMLLPYDDLDRLEDARLPYRWGSDYLRLGQLKIFMDGALGSQTAYISRPYPERPGFHGIAVRSEEQLREAAVRASAAGYPLAVHAIGDVANHQTLNALQSAPGLRHRVEHCQCLDPADVPRFAALGVVASVQPLHATSDRDTAERHWGPLAAHAYVFRSLRAAGARMAFGSDVPVESCDPLKGIYAAVSRKRESEPERPAWHPEQRLKVEQALEGYTVGAAFAVEQGKQRGRLKPGMFADLAILSEDLLNVAEARIPGIRVMGTMVGGELVFRSF